MLGAQLLEVRGPIYDRAIEVAWVLDCVDDVWADVLHQYGKDIWELPGAQAMKLAFRLTDVTDVNTATDPARWRSSVFQHYEASRENEGKAEVVGSTTLAAFAQRNGDPDQATGRAYIESIDPQGDGEFVEVVA